MTTKLIATMVTLNAVDVLPFTLANLEAQGVEQVLAIDQGSADGTWELLRQSELVSQSWRRPSDHFDQGRLMSELSDRAYRAGAHWVINSDCDELWHGLDLLRNVPPVYAAVAVPLFNHLALPGDEPFYPERCRRVGERACWKVAHRAALHRQVFAGSHGVDTTGPTHNADPARLHITHFPIRSREQFRRKVERARVVLPGMRPHEADHWRRWVAELEAGGLDGIYDAYCAMAAQSPAEPTPTTAAA